MDADVTALGEGGGLAVFPGDDAVVRCRRDGNGRIVLLRAVHGVKKGVIGIQVVNLRSGLVVDCGPGSAAVVGDAGATIISFDHAAVVLGIDPEGVVIPVWGADLFPVPTAIIRAEEREAHHVYGFGIDRVGLDVHVIPGAASQFRFVAEHLPGQAIIIGAVEALALFGFDERPDAA